MQETKKTVEEEFDLAPETEASEADVVDEEAEEQPEKAQMPIIKDIENAEDVEDILYEKSFSFSYVFNKGSANEVERKGTFTCKRFNLVDAGTVGVDLARLNQGQAGLDNFTLFIHEMLAFCGVALVKAPKWWRPETFYEEEPLRGVYNHIREWHASFR
jgi:hypothetical protein